MKIISYTLVYLMTASALAHADSSSIERGRYLSIIGGCNDCHTAGYASRGGNVPEAAWLEGDTTGWYGPWGTTYPVNLRKLIGSLTPEAWLTLARTTKARPPMPAYVLRTMTETDLLALYDFIRALKPAGVDMPAALPPGVMPETPYMDLSTIQPKR